MSEETTLFFDVAEEQDGDRVDKFLAKRAENLSRSRVQGLIQEGNLTCNGEVLRQGSYKVCVGDQFSLVIPEVVAAGPEAENISLDIVYEDDDLLVINKPVGLVVHPGAGNWSGTLVNALIHHCGESLSGIGGVARPGIVHRLDKDTAGLMMVAKNDFAHQGLSEQLADRSLSRVYQALVVGVPMPIKGSVDRPIGRHRHDRLRMSVMSNAPKEACTHYLVLQSFGEAVSLVECRLETGRTHQIRVHMDAIGHPLVGDPLYGAQPTLLKSKLRKENYSLEIIENFTRTPVQMLCAKEIHFIHPRSGEEMVFTCDLHDRMSKLLKSLT